MSALTQPEIDRLFPRDDATSFRAFGHAVAKAGEILAGNPTEQGMRTFLRSLSMLMQEVEHDMAAHRPRARDEDQRGGGAC